MSLSTGLMTVHAYGYGHMDGNGNGWMWLWGGLMMILLVAAVGLVAWVIVHNTKRGGPHPHDRAREILAERFARGEITPEEYRERAEHLA
jgi:putative membrane protein